MRKLLHCKEKFGGSYLGRTLLLGATIETVGLVGLPQEPAQTLADGLVVWLCIRRVRAKLRICYELGTAGIPKRLIS